MKYKEIDPKLAGIYIFKNNINGKCYVGQSVNLRSRLKHHMSNLRAKRYDLPLYRALEKYGVHNFTFDILESFERDPNMPTEELIKLLDDMEIKYIEEYEAYTKGYNCTKGGDFGVLGLKMTEEQKKRVSENSKRAAVWSYRPVYLYNVETKHTIYAISITAAAKIINGHRSGINRVCAHTQWLTKGYLGAFSQEDLDKRKLQYEQFLKERIDNCNGLQLLPVGKLEPAYSVTAYNESSNILIIGSVHEVATKLKCATTTIYNALSRGNLIFGKYRVEKEIIKGTKRTINKGRPSPRKGVKMSNDQKKKITEALHKYNVLQFDKLGNYITTFYTIKDAAKAVNTDEKSIRRACKGKAATCKGFVWKYELKQLDRKQVA